MEDRKPWSFCETPEEKCTMNYCDDNGCLNRNRNKKFTISGNSKKPINVTDSCSHCAGTGIDPAYGFGIYNACPECENEY